MATYKMADTLTAARVKGLSNPLIMYAHLTLKVLCLAIGKINANPRSNLLARPPSDQL